MTNINIGQLFYGAILILANVFAISMLPRTAGFSKASSTILCILGFVVTAWALSRLVHSGMQLSILMPLAAAVIPFAGVIVGMFLFNEPASPMKLGILVTACGLIGVAARL